VGGFFSLITYDLKKKMIIYLRERSNNISPSDHYINMSTRHMINKCYYMWEGRSTFAVPSQDLTTSSL